MKKVLSCFLVCCMLIVAMPSAVFSQTAVTAYGTVTNNGSNLPWRLYDDGTLIVDSGFIN